MGKLTRDFKQLDAMKDSLLAQNEGLVAKIEQLERANRALIQKLDVFVSIGREHHDEEVRIATDSKVRIASLTREKEILKEQLRTARNQCFQCKASFSGEVQAGIGLHTGNAAVESDWIADTCKFRLVNNINMPETPPASPDIIERPDTNQATSVADPIHSRAGHLMDLPTKLESMQAWADEVELVCVETTECLLDTSSFDTKGGTSGQDQGPSLPTGFNTLLTHIESSQDWAEDAQWIIRQLTIGD